ncbi:MAG TPA: hypothetical protein VKJ01_01010, partial [Candidatus Solibacter sp.]|nr:hypothetical protein [Candidatus Solibacter sp.]
SQDADDGIYDTNWTSSVNSAYAFKTGPFAYREWGDIYQVAFIPDFNRFVMAAWISTPGSASPKGAVLYDLGPYPWGAPVAIAQISRHPDYLSYFPCFPQVLNATYRKTSGRPLIAAVSMSTTGTITYKEGGPEKSGYGPYRRDLTLVPRAATARRAVESRTIESGRRRNTHAAAGLDLYYDFQGFSGSLTIPNLSPNDPAQSYATTVTAADGIAYDQYGMYNFGFPAGSVDISIGTGQWRGAMNYLLTTPYRQTLGAFTAVIVFGHYPGGLTVPAVSGEIVMAKGTDLTVMRHGTSAAWDVTVMGTVLGAVAIPDGGFGCIVIRRDSDNSLTVFSGGAAGSTPALSPVLGPATVTGAWSSANLTFGSATNSLRGVISEALVFSRALSGDELIRELGATRNQMAARGIVLP